MRELEDCHEECQGSDESVCEPRTRPIDSPFGPADEGSRQASGGMDIPLNKSTGPAGRRDPDCRGRRPEEAKEPVTKSRWSHRDPSGWGRLRRWGRCEG
jgi:hypothetical protein